MADSQSIAAGKVVGIHYTLTLDDGTQVDSSAGGDPLYYLHGAQNVVPGLEEQLTGKDLGSSFDVQVPPEKGYGPRDPEGRQSVPRDQFPADLDLKAEMILQAEDKDGNVTPVFVLAVEDGMVEIDFNHPLAGKTLNFAIQVDSIRDATAEETEHGHPHGADGTGGHDHD